jgi:hypothetical protein
MTEHPPIPREVLGMAWHEFRYPHPALDAPSAAFERAMAVVAQWLSGMAVVPLPEPTRAGCIWEIEDGEEIHASVDEFGPRVSVQTGDFWALFPAAVLRARALAELAAADRAEQLAADATGVTP